VSSKENISHIMPVYAYRAPVSFTHGKGVWLWAEGDENEPYLDALSGRGVSNLGHQHPAIIQTIHHQANKLLHTSNLYRIPQQEELALALCKRFDMSKAFFANSGAESIEAVLKLAKCYAHRKSISNPIIISLSGSYHGRSLAALEVSGSSYLKDEKKAAGINKLNTVVHVPLNDIITLHHTVQRYASQICAILIEPIQGDGGIRICSNEFLQTVRHLCDHYDYLMIADEIQTGLCRTGQWLGCDHASVKPDVIVLAKSLGNGIPIGAYLVNKKADNLLTGYHGSTFAGNPLACACALSVLKVLEEENIVEVVRQTGTYLKKTLQGKLSKYPFVKGIRGEGLMLGIELDHLCQKFIEIALQHKLLLDVVASHTIRLLPPLTLTLSEAQELVDRLERTFQDYLLLI
jgi:acetylornithine aminotransferase